jgi:HNH endonuclease/AP2 domain
MHIKHNNKSMPDAEFLRQRYSYDPDTGILIRLPRPQSEFPDFATWRSFMIRLANKPVTKKSRGYVTISVAIEGKSHYCMAHRAIWAMVTGAWPETDIDHKNRVRDDNRWENLRAASDVDNAHNKSICYRNKSGFKGVHWLPENKKWRAQIRLNGKVSHLGCFEELEEAASAYRKAAIAAHGQFACF